MEIDFCISSKQCTLLLIFIDDCSIVEQLLKLSKKYVFENNILLIMYVAY